MSFAQPADSGNEPGPGTKDNHMANPPGDHDTPYEFGRVEAYLTTFSQIQRARMLIVRSRLDDVAAIRNRRVKPPKPVAKKEGQN